MRYINFKILAGNKYNCDETISSALCVVQLEEDKLRMEQGGNDENNNDIEVMNNYICYQEDDYGNIIQS